MYQLRDWQIEDAKGLAKHANNFKIAEFMTNGFPYPYSDEDAERFVKMAIEHPTSIFKAIDVGGEAVGGIGIHPQDDIYEKNAELGYWLSEQHWRKGIMTAAIREMLCFGFSKLAINRIFAISFGSNEGSKKVLVKAGFQLESILEKTIYKNGEYQDEHIYSVRRDQHAGESESSSS